MQITHWYGSTNCFKDDSVIQCNSVERVKFDPHCGTVPKPSNRWPPNLAWVMRSGMTPTAVQNFITIQ